MEAKLYAVLTLIVGSCYLGCKNDKANLDPIQNVTEQFTADKYEATVDEFREFIAATDYVTTADSFGWSGFFDISINKWDVRENANWERQDGINKSEKNLPVVHISYYDACAYCGWKGGRLPTAAEWDWLAGDTIIVGNVWQGLFPYIDEGLDGYKVISAPVGQFMPNAKGYYDMFGNVWEWTSTLSPSGQRIIKGGSFLCDYNVCQGYIPSKYQTTEDDSGLNHLGIRCLYEIKK